MRYKYWVLIFVTPIIIILDQLSKFAVSKMIPNGGSMSVISGFFDLVHTYNTGAAFGFLAQTSESFRVPFFYIVAIVAAVFLIYYFYTLADSDRLMIWTLSFIFGGMVGNMIDRMRMGKVLDFLSAHIGERVVDFSFFGYHINFPLMWPAFNIADSAITAAIFLLLIGVFAKRQV